MRRDEVREPPAFLGSPSLALRGEPLLGNLALLCQLLVEFGLCRRLAFREPAPVGFRHARHRIGAFAPPPTRAPTTTARARGPPRRSSP